MHLNRLIRRHDLDAIFLAGPGHGAPGVLAPVYLEGTYAEIYPDKGEDEDGLRRFFKEFSFPGGIGSHCTPETARLDPRGRRARLQRRRTRSARRSTTRTSWSRSSVGDGEAETGPLATSWHSNEVPESRPRRRGAADPAA